MTKECRYYLYLLECIDNSYYCGITTDVNRRLRQHNNGKASKYTRGRLPVKLIGSYYCGNRSNASKEEYKVKKMKKMEKVEWVKLKTKKEKRRGVYPHEQT